jgi:Flavin containing amine oxidoreductase
MQYFATAANCLKQQSKKLFNDWQDYNPATDGALNVLGGNECDWSVRPAVANLDYYARWQFLDYEFAQKDTSMYSFLKRKDFIAKLYFVMDQDQGFQKIPISFAREYLGFTEGVGGANFQFRQTVAAIRYDRADAVYKTAIETNVDSQGCPRYRFEAKRVISTLPVGVLRSQDVRFDPPLPYGENPFVMADYIKVFYQFDEKFWDGTDDKEFIVSLKKANNDGKCNTWTSLDYSSSANTPYTSSQIIPGSRIIFCTLTTEALNQLLSEAGGNDLTDAQLRGELLEPLKRIFGADIVASVVSIKYSDLWKNPSFYGSYENWRVGPDLKAYYQYHGGILPSGDPIGSCDANTRSRSLDEQHALGPTLLASPSAVQRPPRPTRRRPRPTAAPVRRPTRAPTSRPTPAPPVHNGCTPDGLWTLHISGSASCAASWGFVHGAIEAGERSANYVLADIGCRGVGCAVSTESSCDDLESQANSP